MRHLVICVSLLVFHVEHAEADIVKKLKISVNGTLLSPQRGILNLTGVTGTVDSTKMTVSIGAPISPLHISYDGSTTQYGSLSVDNLQSRLKIDATLLGNIEVGTSSTANTNITVGVTSGSGITTINGGTLILNVGQNGGGDINCAGCGAGGIARGLIGLYGTSATPWVSLGKTSDIRLLFLGRLNGDFTMDGKGDTTGSFTGGSHVFSCDESTGTNPGCDIQIVPGPAHGTNQNGGTLTLNGGAPTGGGTKGVLYLGGSSTNTGSIQIGNSASETLVTGALRIDGDIIPPPPAGSNQVNFRAASGGNLIARVDANTNKGFYAWSANGTTAKLSVDTTVGIEMNYNGKVLTIDNNGVHVTGAGATFDSTGGSANKATCWKNDGKTLGYCSTVVDITGGCTCN